MLVMVERFGPCRFVADCVLMSPVCCPVIVESGFLVPPLRRLWSLAVQVRCVCTRLLADLLPPVFPGYVGKSNHIPPLKHKSRFMVQWRRMQSPLREDDRSLSNGMLRFYQQRIL